VTLFDTVGNFLLSATLPARFRLLSFVKTEGERVKKTANLADIPDRQHFQKQALIHTV
jgi:hypothetical protein